MPDPIDTLDISAEMQALIDAADAEEAAAEEADDHACWRAERRLAYYDARDELGLY